MFESTTLDPYLEIANKLHEYVEAHQDMPGKEEELKDHLKVIEIIRNELETSLKRLSSPSEEPFVTSQITDFSSFFCILDEVNHLSNKL